MGFFRHFLALIMDPSCLFIVSNVHYKCRWDDIYLSSFPPTTVIFFLMIWWILFDLFSFFRFWKSIACDSVVRPGLIGIGMLELGFIGAPKRIYWKLWKANWSNCVVSLLIFLQTVEDLWCIARVLILPFCFPQKSYKIHKILILFLLNYVFGFFPRCPSFWDI